MYTDSVLITCQYIMDVAGRSDKIDSTATNIVVYLYHLGSTNDLRVSIHIYIFYILK